MEPANSKTGELNILSMDDDGYWLRVWDDFEREDECRIFIPTFPQQQ